MAVGLLTIGISAFAQEVNAKRHPNLADAQQLIVKAQEKLTEAQKANDYDMKGHDAKAKKLLDDAYHEIGLAARDANEDK